MKKFLIVISMFVILVGGMSPQNDFSLLDYFNGEYCAYSNNPLTENYVNLGTCYMNMGRVQDVKCLIGESMVIQDFEVGSALKKLKAKVVKTEYLETGAVVIYAYSSLIYTSVIVENREVNLQIANYNDYSVIGWPLILGSF